MTSIMGLQQQTQAAPQDTVDYAGYLQSSHNHQIHGKQSERQQLQGGQKLLSNDHNTSVASTKGLLNGPGQNNCFLNSAVQATISHGGNYICGASIIDKYWLITAAHCVQAFKNGFMVRVGTSLKNSGGENCKVNKLIKYPRSKKGSGKNDTGYDDDLALLKVSKIIKEAHEDHLVKYIIGGNKTDVNHVPYLATISYDENYQCGASIIDKYWLITAAHCVQELQSEYTVRIGTSYKNSGGEEHQIDKVIKYPPSKKSSGKDDTGYNDDMALIKLEKPINLKNNQKPIPLARPDDNLEIGRKMQVSGFGATSENGGASRVLRTAFVPIVDQNECKKLYSYDPPTDRVFCAGYVESGGVDSCFGDSGGPAVLDGKLVGIVMGGDGCARPGFPGIYMRVSAFYYWIAETTGLFEKLDEIYIYSKFK